jgi:DNA-binding response OmpR family regulator
MRKVLVVDDDKDILEVVELLLTINNYTVKTIFNASETLGEIKKFKPNIILLDINIAGHDGRDICKQLRLIKNAKNIPVILFSAMPELEQLHHTCGATDFLSKPFNISELIKKIEKHFKAA